VGIRRILGPWNNPEAIPRNRRWIPNEIEAAIFRVEIPVIFQIPMEPHGPTPLGAGALRCASAKASEGYPPVAKSAEALILRLMNDPTKAYTFIHRQSPCLHAEVPAFVETFRAGVSARRRGLLRRRIKFRMIKQ
jgi:hypothetical protein